MKIPGWLLVGAAGLFVAVGAGQAAELHGKAKTADRMKNCSAYGAGFRYVPGAGACVKVGGWTRAEALAGGSTSWSPFNGNASNGATLGAKGYVTTDIRKRTDYGTVRAYLSVGVDHP